MIITIEKDFRKFKKGDVIDLSLVRDLHTLVMVSDNGIGKSSLLHAIRGYKNDKKSNSLNEDDFSKLAKNISIKHDYDKIFHFDSVKDNGSDIMNAFDAYNYVKGGGFMTKRISHGESAWAYIAKFFSDHKDLIIPNKTLLVFDEIDNGLSMKNMVKFNSLIEGINDKMKCDILIVSHNPFFISKQHICYDLEKRGMVSSDEYIREQTGYTIKENKK